MKEDRYWIRSINNTRMRSDSTVLYRPSIVNKLIELVEQKLTSDMDEGIMAQGVGKSYSLVNLNRCLLASGNYLVTMIPDCANWGTMDYLFRCILNSVGVDARFLNLTYSSENDDYSPAPPCDKTRRHDVINSTQLACKVERASLLRKPKRLLLKIHPVDVTVTYFVS